MSRTDPDPGFRVTPRDREIVRWIGRLRMVTAVQVAERFGLGRAVGYARLGGLVQLGLLEHARIFHAFPGVYLATRAGLRVVDLELPPARVDVRTYEHDLELSSLVIQLEREFGRDRVMTEREIRSVDAQFGAPGKRPRFAVPLTAGGGQLQLTPVGHPRLHFPDCATSGGEASTGITAVELERSVKGRTRLRQILSAYIGARHVGSVLYYAANERVYRLVSSVVTDLKAEDLVTVIEASQRRNVGIAKAA